MIHFIHDILAYNEKNTLKILLMKIIDCTLRNIIWKNQPLRVFVHLVSISITASPPHQIMTHSYGYLCPSRLFAWAQSEIITFRLWNFNSDRMVPTILASGAVKSSSFTSALVAWLLRALNAGATVGAWVSVANISPSPT